MKLSVKEEKPIGQKPQGFYTHQANEQKSCQNYWILTLPVGEVTDLMRIPFYQFPTLRHATTYETVRRELRMKLACKNLKQNNYSPYYTVMQ